MSLTEDYRARRRRLLTPPNGRDSSELDIVSEAVARRIEAEKRAEIRAANEERERLKQVAKKAREDAERRRAELIKAEEDWIKRIASEGVRIRTIIDYCCKKYRVGPLDILGLGRTASICDVRHIIAYLCCELTGYSTPEIGRCLGGRDHTTILNSRKRMKAKIAADPEFAAEIEAIKAALRVA
jgi:chromosomal replication initiation ATPase DnaA